VGHYVDGWSLENNVDGYLRGWHFVLPGRVSPLLRARKVSACGRFAASVLFFASTVANFCVY
jgi:hypothetical protein